LSNIYERAKFLLYEEMLMNDQDFTNLLNVAPARVAGVVRQYLKTPEDVEDVVQTTLLKVWEHRATYNPAKSDIWTWVHQIATNTAIDFLRAEGTRRGLIPEGTDDSWDHLVDNYPDETPGPEEEAYTMQVIALARVALDALPPDQREVFVLRTSKGLTHKQIAATLGISVTNSQTLFERARKQICDKLGFDTYN
jgi:RNA polymerase sigma-70 factor, ECF subfamily